MPSDEKDTVRFAITLPREACEMLDALSHYGLYGKKRAGIAANLIIDHLKLPEVEKRVEKGLKKRSRPDRASD